MSIVEKIKIAEEKTNTSPTEGQKRSGNYSKGKVTIKGLRISIENPAGTVRSGISSSGKTWSIKMPYSYGYFNSTLGRDGDQVDVYLGTDFEDTDLYIIDQIDVDTKTFDEHKIMFGFGSEELAKEAYLSCYEDGWKGFGNITKVSLTVFKKWLRDNLMNKYPASKINTNSYMDIKNIDLGDRIALARIHGEVISEKTLSSLKTQAGDEDNFDKLIIEIASPGGSVSEGLEIMMWLDDLSNQGKQIITVVVANAYSIASLIMLAADIRLISKHGKVMVHNPMLPELKYVNANDLEKHIEELRDLEDKMYGLYEIFTGLSREKIKILMDNETYLLPKEVVEYNFADMVVDIKPKSYEMTTNIKKEVNMRKTRNLLHKVVSMVNQTEFVNQVYYTEDGEIEIFQNDPATYSKEDRTSLEQGVVKLSDGSKLVIEDYVIVEIDKAVELEPKLDEDGNPIMPMENADEPKLDEDGNPIVEVVDESKSAEDEKTVAGEFNEGSAPVKAKDDMPGKVVETTESVKTTKEVVATQITSISKWDSEVINDTFELETEVKYAADEFNPEPYSVGSGEWQLDDGRIVLTDSDGIIRFIKPAAGEVQAKDVEVEAKVNEDFQAKFDEVVTNMKDEFEAKFKALEEKMVKGAEEVESKLKDSEEVMDLATEAIQAIASSTGSSFKPSAISKVEAAPTGSIFTQMKMKAEARKRK